MIYSCGPTVYDKVHIGNLRIYILSDVLRLYLKQVSIINITDIDDKILLQLQDNVSYNEYQQFINAHTLYFFKALKSVNVEYTEHKIVKVSDYIPEILQFIKLINPNNLVKDAGNSLRFKNDNTNFVVWKTHSLDKVSWPSELGAGRPGWHVECAAIIYNTLQNSSLLNLQYHLAGLDLKPIHNAAETVLLSCVNTKIRTWIHVASVCVNHKKMSKSKNNSIFIEDLPTSESYVIRFLMLSQNYNKTINYTSDVYLQKRKELLKIYQKLINFQNEDESNFNFLNFCELYESTKNAPVDLVILNSGFILSKLKLLETKLSYNLYLELNQYYKILPSSVFDKSFIFKIKTLLAEYKVKKIQKNYEISDKIRLELQEIGFFINDKTFELIAHKF